MGQIGSSCTSETSCESNWSCSPWLCCSGAQASEDVDSDNNPTCTKKIKTNTDKVILAVDPNSSDKKIAADRMKILMNYGTKT